MPKLAAWERQGLDPTKMLAFCFLCGAASGGAVYITTRGVMPNDSLLLGGILSFAGFYLAYSLPGRVEKASALAQSREAASLAVLGSTTIEATHSRTRATLLLRSREPSIASALRTVSRKVLLGHPANVAIGSAGGLASNAVREVLHSISSPAGPPIVDEGEEAQAIDRSSQLSDETKSPLFMTAAFFTPLMLFLYALIAHSTSSPELAELVLFQVILLDVAFHFSS